MKPIIDAEFEESPSSHGARSTERAHAFVDARPAEHVEAAADVESSVEVHATVKPTGILGRLLGQIPVSVRAPLPQLSSAQRKGIALAAGLLGGFFSMRAHDAYGADRPRNEAPSSEPDDE